MAPFKPLKIRRREEDPLSSSANEALHRDKKPRRTLGVSHARTPLGACTSQNHHSCSFSHLPAVVGAVPEKIIDSRPAKDPEEETHTSKYNILWRKQTAKKNKTWDGDGILKIVDGKCTVVDASGRVLSEGKVTTPKIEVGETIKISHFDIEIDSKIATQDENVAVSSEELKVSRAIPKFIPPKSSRSASLSQLRRKEIQCKPRHDPNSADAFVLPRPEEKPGVSIVDVVVDPRLNRHLRPHQRTGVQFMYECLMQLRDTSGSGALLADEMGLGKTLMAITLLWTMLKQTPYAGQPPIAKRVLIVCPVTLVNNWKKEFRKWLGIDRIGVFVVDGNTNIRDFVASRVYQVLIIGYERLRSLQQDLRKANFDVVVCDEGHRLKKADNKCQRAIAELEIEKRLILTGTPLQNDLREFFVMADFLNPGVFATYNCFKKEFEIPIMRSRQPGVKKEDFETGQIRLKELSDLCQKFVLRRTSDTLAAYLPAKTEIVIFCRPTKAQLESYRELLESSVMSRYLGSNDVSDHLRAIMTMRKLSNAPSLLSASDGQQDAIHDVLSPYFAKSHDGGKQRVLTSIIKKLKHNGQEKAVFCSGFTKTLDILENIMKQLGLKYLRLDGSTQASKRQSLVDSFNKSSPQECFSFLLSVRSGGTGLNLTGASRLFLFDTDWNPAVDRQAMARIHRDGQTRPVFIYRLISTGMMDEKMYQRQLTKSELSDNFIDGKDGLSGNTFEEENLKELFALHQSTTCQTHELLECPCNGDGSIFANEIQSENDIGDDLSHSSSVQGYIRASELPRVPENNMKRKMKGLYEYRHIDPRTMWDQQDKVTTGDTLLDQVAIDKGCGIDFIFSKSHTLDGGVKTTEVDTGIDDLFTT